MSIQITKNGNQTLLMASKGETRHVTFSAFQPAYLEQNNLIIKKMSGRGAVYFYNWPSQNAVNTAPKLALRHYRRGGLVAKVSEDLFIYHGIQQTRCYQELAILAYLQEQGVSVPTPIAGLITQVGLFYKADIITQVIINAQELHETLQVKTLTPETWQQIGLEIQRMHKAGVCHDDINVKNILLQEEDAAIKVYIIDFDKCKIKPDGTWKEANLARFKRSLVKQSHLYKEQTFSEKSWQHLLAGYHA